MIVFIVFLLTMGGAVVYFKNFPLEKLPMGESTEQLQKIEIEEVSPVTSPKQNLHPSFGENNFASTTTTYNTKAKISITPKPGTKIRPGEKVKIVFSIEGGNPTKGAIFSIDGKLGTEEGSGPYSISYTTPKETFRELEIIATTFGDGPENYEAETSIIVGSALVVKDIVVENMVDPLDVDVPYVLRVNAIFSDGSKGDISRSPDIQYSVLSGNTKIISVDKNGVITANGEGSDVLVVSYKGVNKKVPVSAVLIEPSSFLPEIKEITPIVLKSSETRRIELSVINNPNGEKISFHKDYALSVGSLSGGPMKYVAGEGEANPSKRFFSLTNNGNGDEFLDIHPDASAVGTYHLSIFADVAELNSIGIAIEITITP
jgi:hypothetical protein